MHTRQVATLAVLGLAVGCGPEPTVPQRTVTASASAALLAPPLDVLALPAGDGSTADWLEAAVAEPQPLRVLLQDRQIVSHGEHVVIFETAGGQFFAAHDARGVFGPLAVPAGARFVRLDGTDRVYAATASGKLFAAADMNAALAKDGFVPLSEVPGAVAWDAGGKVVAAAKGPGVAISKDGGKTWATTIPLKGLGLKDAPAQLPALDDVRVRGDGVLAAHDVDMNTFTSADGGATWKRFSVQTRVLQQEGAMIFVGNPRCPIILSRDGVSWDADAPALATLFAGRGDWNRTLETDEGVIAHASRPMISASDPKPPPRPKRPYTGVNTGDCSGSASGIGVTPFAVAAPACGGAFCLDHAFGQAPLGRSRFELFGDAQCDPADADPKSHLCKPDAKLVRPPTLAIGDPAGKTVRAVPLPDPCRFEQLFATAGAALLLCAEGPASTGVFMADARGGLHGEGSLDSPASAFSRIAVGPDGTLLLHCDPAKAGCKTRVRAPLELGAASAWRVVDVPNARLYRPWLAGAVLAFSAPTEAAFSLLLDRPGAPPVLLARDVPVADVGRIHGVSLEAGNVTLETSQGELSRRLVVTKQGGLAQR